MELQIEQFLQQDFTEATRLSYRFGLSRFSQWIKQTRSNPAKLNQNGFRDFLYDQKTWNHNSRYSAYCAIRSYLRWKYGGQHPALRFKLKRGKTPPQRSLDRNQLTNLIKSIDNSTPHGVRNLAMICLMSDTGLRAIEICRLYTKYVKIEQRSLNVYSKGSRWETAVFSLPTAQYLEEWVYVRSIVLRGMNVSDPQTMFFGIGGRTPGRPMTPCGMRDIFERLAEQAGIGRFSPHDLRRTFTTLALQAGASTRIVQCAGRWSDIRLVERYSPKISARDMEPYFPVNQVVG